MLKMLLSGQSIAHKLSPAGFKWLLLLLFIPIAGIAAIPPGYYNAAEGRRDAALKTVLHTLIRPHTQLEYYSSSTHFRTTDWHPDGYFWDMYSREKRTSWSNLNREHCMPKSWWSPQPEYTVAYSDLHNLYPSNVEANSAKSNFPLGIVGANYEFDNGVSKVGYNTYPGYQGMVYEPAGEYKGDFARTYMYMVTCYEDYAPNWRSTGTESMLYQNTFPVFKPYAISLLMKWHRDDPVSQKEIDRNNAVYAIQGNRNPYIDYPAFAEFIWGNSKGQPWDAAAAGGEIQEKFAVSYQFSRNELSIFLSPAAEVPYHIYSIDGRMVYTGQLSGALTTILSLEGKVEKGVYLIIALTKRKKHDKLFIVL
jgi:endonuclease I